MYRKEKTKHIKPIWATSTNKNMIFKTLSLLQDLVLERGSS